MDTEDTKLVEQKELIWNMMALWIHCIGPV